MTPAEPAPIHRTRAVAGRHGPWLLLWLVVVAYSNYLIFGFYGFETGFSGDSPGYLSGSPMRTPGYPLFLDLIAAQPGFPATVAPLQLNLLLLSLALFCATVASVFSTRWVPAVIVVLSGSHFEFLSHGLALMTEAPFIALLLAHLSAVFQYFRSRTTGWLVVASVLALLTILIRPVGYCLLGSLVYLALTDRLLARPKALLALFGPVAAGLLLTASVGWLRSGDFGTQSIGGYALVGHVAYGIADDPDSAHPDISAAVQRALDARYQHRQHPSEALDYYRKWSSREYNRMLWQIIVPTIRVELARQRGIPESAVSASQINAVALDLALEAIAREPWAYVRNVFAHYEALWRLLLEPPRGADRVLNSVAYTSEVSLHHSGWAPEGFIRSLPTQRFEEAAGGWWHTATRWPWQLPRATLRAGARLLWLGCLLLGLAALILNKPALARLGYAAVTMQLCFLLVAASQVALVRYATPLVPILLFLVTAGLLETGRAVGRRGRGEFRQRPEPII